MIWSDPTNEQGIVQDCDWWAGTNEATFPLPDKVRAANKSLRQIGRRIIRSMYGETFLDDNNLNFNVEYTDLNSGGDNITLELGMFVIERVRIKDKNGTYRTLEQVTRRNLSDEELNAVGTPRKFYRTGQTIAFYPAPDYNADDGIEVEYQKSLEQAFTATGNNTRVPGFNEDYHPLVPLYMAREYTSIYDKERYEACELEIVRIEKEMDKDFQKRNRTKPLTARFKQRTSHIM